MRGSEGASGSAGAHTSTEDVVAHGVLRALDLVAASLLREWLCFASRALSADLGPIIELSSTARGARGLAWCRLDPAVGAGGVRRHRRRRYRSRQRGSGRRRRSHIAALLAVYTDSTLVRSGVSRRVVGRRRKLYGRALRGFYCILPYVGERGTGHVGPLDGLADTLGGWGYLMGS